MALSENFQHFGMREDELNDAKTGVSGVRGYWLGLIDCLNLYGVQWI